MRVCSNCFIDGKLTPETPHPTENLGYNSASCVQNMVPSSKRRKLFYKARAYEEEHFSEDSGSSFHTFV